MLTCAGSGGHGENEDEKGLLGDLNADFILTGLMMKTIFGPRICIERSVRLCILFIIITTKLPYPLSITFQISIHNFFCYLWPV